MGAKLRQNWPAAALLGALLLSVIPILLVGDCAHPYGDDYAFSEWIHHAAADGRTPAVRREMSLTCGALCDMRRFLILHKFLRLPFTELKNSATIRAG